MKEHKSVWIEGLTPELIKKAQIELKETPDNQSKALMELRKLISAESDFCCSDDDKFLIKFLRTKKYDVRRAFDMLQNYYSYKMKHPYTLTDKVKDILSTNHIFIPPVRMLDGSGIFISFIGEFDFDKYTLDEYFNAMLVYAEPAIDIETNQICGGHLVVDFKGMTFSKLRHFSSPSFLSMLTKGIENCWPCRMVSCQIMHEPFYVSAPYNLLCSMLSKKLRERIHFHGNDLDSLYKHIPRECLPEQLGGVHGIESFQRQREISISMRLEAENSNNQSTTATRKNSTCGREENTDFLCCTNSMSKVAF